MKLKNEPNIIKHYKSYINMATEVSVHVSFDISSPDIKVLFIFFWRQYDRGNEQVYTKQTHFLLKTAFAVLPQ